MPRGREELDPRHPLLRRQAGFSREVMEVDNKALEDVLEARIRVVGIDCVHVLGDVVDRQIHHLGEFDLGRIHGCGGSVGSRVFGGCRQRAGNSTEQRTAF